jgi:hypothetical protein
VAVRVLFKQRRLGRPRATMRFYQIGFVGAGWNHTMMMMKLKGLFIRSSRIIQPFRAFERGSKGFQKRPHGRPEGPFRCGQPVDDEFIVNSLLL